jgi:AcrR family transcriptional regulator
MPPIDDTEQRLLDAAMNEFAAKGYDGTSVRDILTRAGVKNIAAVNYYFQGKDNLYARAVWKAYEMCCPSTQPPEVPAELPAREKLRLFIRGMVTHMLQDPNPAAVQLMMREMVQPTTPACAEWVERYIRPIAGRLMSILTDLLPPDTPPRKRWMTGFSLIGQCLHYRQNRRVMELLVGPELFAELYDVDRVAEHIVEFSLGGINAVGQAFQPDTPSSGWKA